MSFKEFDLSDYISALEDFKANNTNEVMKHWGSIQNFDILIQKIKDKEDEVAKLAIKQFGSIEKYTEAMRYNLEHFSEVMEEAYSQIPEEMKCKDSFAELASNKDKDVSSDEVQNLVHRIISFAQKNVPSELFDNNQYYCNTIIKTYSNEYLKTMFDTKQGEGASDFIVNAFRYYSENNVYKNN